MDSPDGTELWRPIPGYEGRYSASTLGDVRRDRAFGYRPQYGVLHPVLSAYGYLTGLLYAEDGRRRMWFWHRLITLTFMGPPPLGLFVNHKNGVKTDNHLHNLEYVTPRDNIAHAIEHGLRPRSRGSNHYKAKLSWANVISIRLAFRNGERTADLARQYNVVWQTIANIRDHKTWRLLY